MQVTLGEDDGFLFNGTPHNVVVTVSFDDGRVLKFPYSAQQSISELYDALKNVPEDKKNNRPLTFDQFMSLPAEKLVSPIVEKAFKRDVDRLNKSNEIEKNDTVRCIKLGDRGKGATVDLHTGGVYRVLAVHQKSIPTPSGEMMNIIDGYDVIDDKVATPIRAFVFSNEIELVSKHPPLLKPVLTKEVDLNCPQCSQKVYCGLKDGIYQAKCECGALVSQSKAAWDVEHPAGKVSA